MGSDAHLVLVDAAPNAVAIALRRIEQLEARWSRFIEDSELSLLNAAGGSRTHVSRDTLVLIDAMRQAHDLTAGVYDPTFLFEVLATGYTASIEEPARVSISIDLPCPGLSVHDAIVDQAGSTVRLPDGLALDAGGIGKGLAADLVVGELLAGGTAGALVSLGGDISAGGRPPDGEAWMVDVADPIGGSGAATRLTVSGGGLATSSTVARRSSRNGRSHHHTIDPATRRPSETDIATVTVAADTGWRAEAHATAALVGGVEGLTHYATTHGIVAIAITTDGTIIRAGDLRASGLEQELHTR